MKHKKSLLFIPALLTFVFLISFTSAALAQISNQSVSLSNSNPSVTITITGSENFTITDLPPFQDASGKVKFTNSVLIYGDKTASFSITATEIGSVNFLDSYSTPFVLTAQGISGNTVSFTITANYENSNFCSEKVNSNIDIKIDSINVKSGFGKDEDYWYPLDEVEVEVKVKYDGGSKDKFQDGQLDWALYTKAGDLITDGDENIKDLKDGKDETITISFQLDPSDLDVGTEDYVLYVSATGTEDLDSGNGGDICDSKSQNIEIRMDDDFVVLDDIKFLPDPASCGSEVEITTDVWNIGADDQDDVSVKVMIDELKINQLVEIGSIDSFDKETLELKINLPKDAQEKNYAVKLWVYNSDNDIYQNSEDDYSKFEVQLPISGSCSVAPQVTVSASLESGGNSGKPLTVKATITNTGTDLETFSVNIAGYDSFASSATLDQNTVAIGAGQSKDVLITLDINKNISGEQSFNIAVSSNGKTLATQPVQVTIQASSGLGGITGGIINEGNWYLWGIGVLNVILVIIIIIVAIRIARS